MKERLAHVDETTNYPMQYLVARDCPKLLEGHNFYACQCRGPSVLSQDKPSILVSCEYFRAEIVQAGARRVRCGHGDDKTAASGVQFGVPFVRHAEDLSDGGNKD
ncbi:MAG TPA: hypothetical protein PKV98_04415 [Burkholderiaceae bacterium]|nr:hypothetical protein [Burkholderiaceae bacterium]